MFNEIKKTIEWGHDKLTLETGKIARQADSTVIATYGETVVMAAVVFAKESKADQDFFPLTVNYQEKYYAAGKIPGGFFKRERFVCSFFCQINNHVNYWCHLFMSEFYCS